MKKLRKKNFYGVVYEYTLEGEKGGIDQASADVFTF